MEVVMLHGCAKNTAITMFLGARLERWCSIEHNKRVCYELLTFKNMDSCRFKVVSPGSYRYVAEGLMTDKCHNLKCYMQDSNPQSHLQDSRALTAKPTPYI